MTPHAARQEIGRLVGRRLMENCADFETWLERNQDAQLVGDIAEELASPEIRRALAADASPYNTPRKLAEAGAKSLSTSTQNRTAMRQIFKALSKSLPQA